MTKAVCIVGGGRESLEYMWQSAPEMWALKEVTFPLIEKGYPITKSFWPDDLTIMGPKWNDGTVEALTEDWPETCPNTQLILSEYPAKTHQQMLKFPYNLFTEQFNSDYINGATAMAFCFALLHKYDRIDLHATDFHPSHEDKFPFGAPRAKELIRQATCVGYWIGYARAKGIEVNINPMSPLLDEKFYTQRGFRVRGPTFDTVERLVTTDKVRLAAVKAQLARAGNPIGETPDDPLAQRIPPSMMKAILANLPEKIFIGEDDIVAARSDS